MSERAQALEAALRELTAMVRGECPSLLNEDSGGCARLSIEIDALLAAPPVGVSPQPDTALKEAATWVLNVVSGVGRAGGEPEPDEGQAAFQALADALSTPDAQVCVWLDEAEPDVQGVFRPSCRTVKPEWFSAEEMAGWKGCPYCLKPLVVGTAPQGGEQ